MWQVWGRRKMHAGICWVNVNKRDHLEDLGIDGRILLNHFERKLMGGVDRINSVEEQIVSCCEHGNEPSVSIKFWEFRE
jgi:hypothetical protein